MHTIFRKLPLFLLLLCFSVRPAPCAGSEPSPAMAGGDELIRGLGIEMVRIPEGECRMGSVVPEAWADEKPIHPVRVSGFQIARTEVTQKQWKALMGNNPSYFQGCDDCPVEKVSWDDAQAFIRKLNQLTGRSFRLPTEAEWEYAAGGGAAHQKWAGTDVETEIGEFMWYVRNSDMKTHPVGLKKPNLYGLHDMSGNVGEWCSDWYTERYYEASPMDNPPGPPAGSGRVMRGGFWLNIPKSVRVTRRVGIHQDTRDELTGFRLALPADR